MEEFIYDDGHRGKSTTYKHTKYVISGDCWECVSHSKNGDGYPKARRVVNGKKGVHFLSRVVYCHHNKCDIPDDLVVRHKCDNPSCINPDHLELGTHKDNIEDRVSRGRQHRGENVGTSILSNDDVRKIKEMLRDGFSNKDIQDLFSINGSIVSNIYSGKQWKHINVKGFNEKFKSQDTRIKESNEKIEQVLYLLDNTNMKQSEIAKRIGVSGAYITRAKKEWRNKL